jgi:hypothetical protein
MGIDHEGHHAFKWWSNDPSTWYEDETQVEGSGTQYFETYLTQETIVQRGKNPILNVITKLGRALSEESIWGANLRQRFGGGYSLIYWTGTQFEVLRSVVYLFLMLAISEDAQNNALLAPILNPMRWFKVYQDNDMWYLFCQGRRHLYSAAWSTLQIGLLLCSRSRFETRSKAN